MPGSAVCRTEALSSAGPCCAADNARVIQMGGGTRELYYYPKSISLVVNVSETNNKSERQARPHSRACACTQVPTDLSAMHLHPSFHATTGG